MIPRLRDSGNCYLVQWETCPWNIPLATCQIVSVKHATCDLWHWHRSSQSSFLFCETHKSWLAAAQIRAPFRDHKIGPQIKHSHRLESSRKCCTKWAPIRYETGMSRVIGPCIAHGHLYLQKTTSQKLTAEIARTQKCVFAVGSWGTRARAIKTMSGAAPKRPMEPRLFLGVAVGSFFDDFVLHVWPLKHVFYLKHLKTRIQELDDWFDKKTIHPRPPKKIATIHVFSQGSLYCQPKQSLVKI